MKRSKHLKLALMGASALTLVACDNAKEVGVFETVDQCTAEEGFNIQSCEASLALARAKHVNVAPKYTSAADCEADFGAANCETAPQQTQSGGSVFMPMMMGYMVGSMLGGNSRASTQPLYRSKNDPTNFRTGDNSKVAGKTGLTKVAASVARAPSTKTSTIRRGGFGAGARSAGAFRSFGG